MRRELRNVHGVSGFVPVFEKHGPSKEWTQFVVGTGSAVVPVVGMGQFIGFAQMMIRLLQ